MSARRVKVKIASVVVLLAIAMTLPPIVVNAFQSFRITHPMSGDTKWSGSVEGIGADHSSEEITVKVHIRTDTDYYQGDATVRSSGKWYLKTTYPTEGAINIVYAKMIDSKGNVIDETQKVRVDLRGSLDDVYFRLEVENLAKYHSPVDVVNYCIRGIYTKSRVRITFNPQYDEMIRRISIKLLAVSVESSPEFEIKPINWQREYNLSRISPGVYESEIRIQCAGPIINLLCAFAGLPTGAGTGVTSLLVATPPIMIDKIIAYGEGGEKFYQDEYEYLGRVFDDLDPHGTREALKKVYKL